MSDEREQLARAEHAPAQLAIDGGAVQPSAFLIELSHDWIVLRASENVHHLLGESHVTLIDEPLGRFMHSQALHDLRNLFSRLSGTTGIARAYRVRLTDRHDLFDLAFHDVDGRVLLEAVASAQEGLGDAFGIVGGLIEGLAAGNGTELLESAARRMRALTGFDRVTLLCGGDRAVSSRGEFARPASSALALPPLLCDCSAGAVRLFPHVRARSSAASALMRAAAPEALDDLAATGIGAIMSVPLAHGGRALGEFICESRKPRRPSFELHAAAELFAQMFAMRLEIERLKRGAA
jgi:light-regulated signal transduction histidine kinase (bacteriophytochrome)